jgi:hypothetical protein
MPGDPEPPPVPTLPRFPTFVINESEPWSVSVAALGWSEKHPPLAYRLDKGPPGATLVEETGTIHWTPEESQGPGEYSLIVSAEPKDAPQQAARTTLEVTVRETPQKPRIAPLAAQIVAAGEELSLRIQAEDLDEPPSNLAYYLGRGAPQGARIQSTTGRLTWTPTPNQQGEVTIPIEVRKADAPLVVSAATLSVTVKPPP